MSADSKDTEEASDAAVGKSNSLRSSGSNMSGLSDPSRISLI
jgi:hypothetical protein